MTFDDLVGFSGETGDTIRRWQEVGLVAERDDYGAEDLERVRLVTFAARRGVSPEDMARYCEEHGEGFRGDGAAIPCPRARAVPC